MGWVVQTIWHILWRFPLPQAIEGEVVSGVCSSFKPFNGSPNPCIHALNCSELPAQNLLTGGRDRVPLRIHRDAHIAVERFPCLHLLDDLLCDLSEVIVSLFPYILFVCITYNLPRNCVRRQGLLVVKPRVCRSNEVLVLKVDKGHSVPDQVNI